MTATVQVALLRARMVARHCIRRAAEILRQAGFDIAFAVGYLVRVTA